MSVTRWVGFWRMEENGFNLFLPWPRSIGWSHQQFYALLNNVEKQAHVMTCFGTSKCRLCGIDNGCKEYSYKGFVWPEGYGHYITNHMVKPDVEFEKMLIREWHRV